MTVNLARYKPTGEYVTVRRINLEACSNEMVTFLQVMTHGCGTWREAPGYMVIPLGASAGN